VARRPTLATILPSRRWGTRPDAVLAQCVVQKKIKKDVPFFHRFTLMRIPATLSGFIPRRATGECMSEDSIRIVITAGIIALMFAWVPILGVICPSLRKSLQSSNGSASREARSKKRCRPASVTPLASSRYADQSRDFLHALSTRGERESSRSQAVSPRVPPSSGV
jgi:hypothetical protein